MERLSSSTTDDFRYDGEERSSALETDMFDFCVYACDELWRTELHCLREIYYSRRYNEQN